VSAVEQTGWVLEAGAQRAVYDILPAPLTVHNVAAGETRCVYANPVARAQLPTTVLAGCGRSADSEITVPFDDRDGVMRAAERAAAATMTTRRPVDWADLLLLAPGTYLTVVPGGPDAWFQTVTSRLDGDHVLVVWTDVQQAVTTVTSLSIAWEETAAVSARLETAIDGMPDRFVVARLTRGPDAELIAAHVEHANAATQTFAEQSGQWSGSEALVGCDIGAVPGLGSEQLWWTMRSVAAFGAPSICRQEQLRADGEIEQAQDTLVFLVGEDHLVLTTRDVTAAAHAERVLAGAWEDTSRVRAVLQTALDSIKERFVVLAASRDMGEVTGWRVETLNAAAADVTGCTVDELVGTSMSQVYGTAASAQLSAEAAQCLLHQQPQRWCDRHTTVDGALIAEVEHVLAPVGEELVVVTSRDVTDITRRELEMQARTDDATHAATHDSLTGLANRTLLLDALNDALTQARLGRRSVLLFADLDRFKPVNDTYGHAVGDQLLVAIASRLGEVSRAGDTVCRLGGDEFVLLLRDIGPMWDETTFLARVETVIAAPVTCHGSVPGQLPTVRVGASFGVYYLDGADAVDAQQALKLADARMYARKASRRGRPDDI
jgi:diguanylate cyclase (GGDEF)-like protein